MPTDTCPPTDRAPASMPFIQARHFHYGRPVPVRLVVIHTTETACKPGVARSVATWFASRSAPESSAHYVVDPGEIILCVQESDTAWHAPPVNGDSIGVEHTARTATSKAGPAFTAEDWRSPEAQAMLARSAALVAALCRRYSIPPVRLSPADLLGECAGICGHADVSRTWYRSTHTDPGDAFPWNDYLEMVCRELATPTR